MIVARNIFIMTAPPAAVAAAPAASFQNLENRARIERVQCIVLARWMEVKLGVRTKTSFLFLPTQGHVFV